MNNRDLSPGAWLAGALGAMAILASSRADAADWELNPRLEAGLIYDDNYRLAAPGGEVDVSGPMADAELELRTLTLTGEFSIAPRVRATYFPDATELDAVDYFTTLNWIRRGQRVNAQLRGDFSQQDVVSSEQPDVDAGGDLGDPDLGDSGRVLVENRRLRYELRPLLAWDLSTRREMQLELGHTGVSFDEQVTDAQVDYDASDVSAGLLTRLNERDSFTVRLRGARYEIGDREPGNAYGAELRWDRRTAAESRWYLRAGAQNVEVTSVDLLGVPQTADEIAWLAGAGLSVLRGRNEMFMDLSRNVGPSSAGTLVSRDQLRLRWTRALTPRLSLLAGLRGTHDQDLDDSPTSTFTERSYATGDLGLQWFWQEEYSLRFAYDFTWQEFRDQAEAATSSGALISILYQPLQRRR